MPSLFHHSHMGKYLTLYLCEGLIQEDPLSMFFYALATLYHIKYLKVTHSDSLIPVHANYLDKIGSLEKHRMFFYRMTCNNKALILDVFHYPLLEMSQFYCILCVFSRVYFAYFYYIISVQIYTCLLSYIRVIRTRIQAAGVYELRNTSGRFILLGG